MSPKQGFIFSLILLFIASIMAFVCVYYEIFSLQLQKINMLIVIVSVILMIISTRKNLIDKKRQEKEVERLQNVFGLDDTIKYN